MEHTLIIGLGNPDPLLENTYHNVGVLAVEYLAREKFKSHKGIFSYTKVGARTFIKPLVFMNESGLAVKEAMRVFNATPENILIIHDDSDILIGDVKYAAGGGSAGHKGIRSIIDHIKTNEFARVRIGIRQKNEQHRKKAEEFVLSPITKKDREALEDVFSKLTL
jgi:PTH1 family peptidyl-tRNA hydrolase